MRAEEAYCFYENMLVELQAEKYFLRMSIGESSGREYLDDKWRGFYGYFEGIFDIGWIAFDNRGGQFWVECYDTEREAIDALKDMEEFYE